MTVMTTTIQRHSGRTQDQLREYKFERNFIKTAEGSVLVSCGDTKVIVTAKLENKTPPWLKGHGWITAEYSMLPGSSQERIKRERKGASGRSAEIQRLIGRSIRAMVDLNKLPEIQITIDCDVIQADGGTRTASISGAYVAVYDCLRHIQSNYLLDSKTNRIFHKDDLEKQKNKANQEAKELDARELWTDGLPILNQVAAVSVGIKDGKAILDLDYPEDSTAQADANFVLSADGKIIEIQGTAEDGAFTEEEFMQMFKLAKSGIARLCKMQSDALAD